MDRTEYEQKIRELAKKILNEKSLQEFLSKKIGKNIDDEEFIKQYNNNFCDSKLPNKNWFLLEEFEENNNILIMGINPGGGTKIKDNLYEFYGFDKESVLKDNYGKELLDILEDECVWEEYHYQNYNLIENGKFFWAYKEISKCEDIMNETFNKILNYDEEKFLEKEFKKIEKKRNKISKSCEKLLNAFNEMYKIERKKSGPYVIFCDLFCYADGTQDNIKQAIEKNKEIDRKKLREYIREILRLYIEYYKPQMIVVTNAYASHLINESVNKKFNDDEELIGFDNKEIDNDYLSINDYSKMFTGEKKVPIVFSSMVSGQRALDKYSYIRLKNRIKEIYDDIKK